ncbi:carbohydrate kinase family protein [Pseudodesulfovibrio tunisiensis]|uniref:carbohydrate kinase family protein n=1 Tax=Pseudodesulfovibrio tunisiensis TaxID=463192 RepID=UPI001FB21545|nr:PfkB family carbohydrate kinase [Pseudodesulfovibrio tunisiensis]
MDASQLLIIGNVNADLILGPMDKWPEEGTETVFSMSDLRPGGSAGNTALALKALDQPCRLISAVGSDHVGRWLQEEYGEAAEGWSFINGPTTVSIGIVHASGDRTFLTTPGHLEQFTTRHIMDALQGLPGKGGLAMLSGVFLSPDLADGYGELIDELLNRGYELAVDPGWPCYGWTQNLEDELLGWFGKCRHILINDKEATALSHEDTVEAAAATLGRQLPDDCIVVIKNGPDGALVHAEGRTFSVPAPRVKPFDTIGAGDCFNAGYLQALCSGEDLKAAVETGVLTASSAINTFPRTHPAMRDIKAMREARTAA